VRALQHLHAGVAVTVGRVVVIAVVVVVRCHSCALPLTPSDDLACHLPEVRSSVAARVLGMLGGWASMSSMRGGVFPHNFGRRVAGRIIASKECGRIAQRQVTPSMKLDVQTAPIMG
jgi:hypothetical protein